MRQSKLFLAIVLVMTLGTFAFAGQAKKDKKVVTSGGLEDSSSDKSQGKGKKKQVIGSVGSDDLIVTGKDELPKVLPPPPPDKAGMIIATNVPNAEVLVNNLKYKTNDKGITSQINIKASKATIVIRHPDFHELSETVALKIGTTLPVPLDLISKYGNIILDGLPQDAQITIDGAVQPGKRDVVEEAGAGIDKKLKIEKALFSRIPTGEHKFKIIHPDYIDWEGVLDVKPGEPKENFVAPPLSLAVAQLNVAPKDGAKASIAGAKVYIDDIEGGSVSPDGTLVVDNIKYKRGQNYKIRVVKNGFIEEKLEKALAIGPNSIEVKLRPIPNSAQLSEYFKSGLGKWRTEDNAEPPKEWKVENIKGGDWLVVQGSPKLGFPRDTNYRDFDAEFTFQMPNGKGIAWAVRVQGANYNDYYLFYLSGPNGKFRNQFRTYIAKNGQFDLSKPEPTPVDCLVKLTPDYLYTIQIQARGNKIDTNIKPETGPEAKGRFIQLGTYTDENPLFYTYGNFAFRTIDGEVVMVKNLFVLPVETQPEEKRAGN